MLIEREFYKTRKDGVNLYRSYSNADFIIRQKNTGQLYSEAIDVEDSPNRYEETDIPIEHGEDPGPEPEEGATKADLAEALNKLGVDTNDQ